MSVPDPTEVALAIAQLTPYADSSKHDFGVSIRTIASNLANPHETLQAIADDVNAPAHVRFAAFYGLTVRLWREKKYREYAALSERYESTFGDEPLYNVFRAQAQQSLGDDTAHLESALDYAEAAVQDLPRLPGVLHLFGELVAAVQERQDSPNRTQLHNAEKALRQAISITRGTYAKYHATMARILTLQKKFDEARVSVQRAYDTEQYTSLDYPVRITEYQLIRQRIQLAEERTRTGAIEAKAIEEMREFRGQLIALLGLLAAVIAFIVSTVSSSTNRPFNESSGAIITQGGVLMVVFASFAAVFRVGRRGAAILSLLAGAVVIFAGLIVGGYQPWNLS
jgi:tetratricopeptide (TPR) repeat protein